MKNRVARVAALVIFATGAAASSAVVAQSPAASQDVADVRDPAHPDYAGCAPEADFLKRFAKLPLKKAVKRVDQSIIYESPSVIQPNNPVTGAAVNSNDLYARSVLGFTSYGNGHTYTFIGQSMGGPRNYAMRVSNTNYTKGTKEPAVNELKTLFVKNGDEVTPLPLTGESETGYCSSAPAGQPQNCYSTTFASFAVPQNLYEQFAESNPRQLIAVTAMRKDGTMAQCPLYFSPLSFKATLLTVDEAYAKAAEKQAKRAAGQ